MWKINSISLIKRKNRIKSITLLRWTPRQLQPRIIASDISIEEDEIRYVDNIEVDRQCKNFIEQRGSKFNIQLFISVLVDNRYWGDGTSGAIDNLTQKLNVLNSKK